MGSDELGRQALLLSHSQGLQYIAQLYTQNVLKSFRDLQEAYPIPRHDFFKYLQLRHALHAQIKSVKLVVSPMPLLAYQVLLRKKVLFHFYITN